MALITDNKSINWEHILASHGEETKLALTNLLNESQVNHDDPAAIVIAGLFLAMRDTNIAFTSVKTVLDSSKKELSGEFINMIEQLRGIVQIAREHLVVQGETAIKDREQQLYLSVKQGVAKAMLDKDRSAATRTAAFYILSVFGTFAIAIASVAIGAFGLFYLQPRNPVLLTGDLDEELISVLVQNEDALQTCLANKSELSGKCVLDMP